MTQNWKCGNTHGQRAATAIGGKDVSKNRREEKRGGRSVVQGEAQSGLSFYANASGNSTCSRRFFKDHLVHALHRPHILISARARKSMSVNCKSSGSPRPSSGMSIALHISPLVISTYIGKLYSRIFAEARYRWRYRCRRFEYGEINRSLIKKTQSAQFLNTYIYSWVCYPIAMWNTAARLYFMYWKRDSDHSIGGGFVLLTRSEPQLFRLITRVSRVGEHARGK